MSIFFRGGPIVSDRKQTWGGGGGALRQRPKTMQVRLCVRTARPPWPASYNILRAHETKGNFLCRLWLEKKTKASSSLRDNIVSKQLNECLTLASSL